MTCRRCDGLVVTEHIADPLEGAHFAFDGWRCLNCGAIDDHVIRANRLASLAVTACQTTGSASGDGALPAHITSPQRRFFSVP